MEGSIPPIVHVVWDPWQYCRWAWGALNQGTVRNQRAQQKRTNQEEETFLRQSQQALVTDQT